MMIDDAALIRALRKMRAALPMLPSDFRREPLAQVALLDQAEIADGLEAGELVLMSRASFEWMADKILDRYGAR